MTYKEIFDAFNNFINTIEINDEGNNIIVKYKKEERIVRYMNSSNISVKKLGTIHLRHLPLVIAKSNIVITNDYNNLFLFEAYSYNKEVKSYLIIQNCLYIKINDGILSKKLDDLPENINEWTDEDLFYFKLKYC